METTESVQLQTIQYNTARVTKESNQNEDLNESMRSRRGRPAAKITAKYLKANDYINSQAT